MGCPVVHFEIGSRDSKRLQEFYSSMFNWQIHSQGAAGFITTGDEKTINGHINQLGHEPHNYVTIYVQVPDVQVHLDKAVLLGAKMLVPVMPIPGVGSFAWIADPEGNIVGLFNGRAL